jgi:hypothetical protein
MLLVVIRIRLKEKETGWLEKLSDLLGIQFSGDTRYVQKSHSVTLEHR